MNNEIPECKRCGHQWFSRSLGKPAKCPKCQSRNYDKPDARTRKELADHNAMKNASKIRG